MESFVYDALAQRVVFGAGARGNVADELDRLGASRAIVISTPGRAEMADEIAALLGAKCVGTLASAVLHTPVAVTEAALPRVADLRADCLIAIGGGSAVGLAKAVALHTDLPQIALPTTYSGSEGTPILGQTENGRKTTQRTLKVLPETVIYDAELTMGMPRPLTITSGMNAVAHAVEALYAENRNPMISLFALEGIRAMTRALPVLKVAPRDETARSDALFGAWACCACLAAVGMALHHKTCHALGGRFDLPHADTHAIVLPHATAYNERAVPELLRPAADILGASTLAGGLYDLAVSLGAPTRLSDIGMPQDGLDEAAAMIAGNPYWNPRPVERDAVREMLDDAFFGRRPNMERP